MEKEEKVGLFRRLFGRGDEEEGKPQCKQPNVVNVSSPLELTRTNEENKVEVLPWEQSNKQESTIEADSAPQQGSEEIFETLKVQNSDRTPTWEELLNKIAPSGHEGGNEQKTEPMLVLDKESETDSQLLWEKPEAESQPDVPFDIPADAERTVTPIEFSEPAVEEPSKGISAEESVVDVHALFTKANEFAAESKPVQEEPETVSFTQPQIEGTQIIELSVTEKIQETNVLENAPVRLLPSEKPLIKNDQVLWLLEQAAESSSQGEMSKAKRFLEIAFSLEQHPDITLTQARYEKALGNMKAAADLCIQSLNLFADSHEGIELLLELVQEGASPDVKALSAIDSGDVKVNTNLAKLFLSQGSLDSALNFFTKAQAQGLNVDNIQFELGLLFDQMGDLTKAKEHYQRALELTDSQDNVDIACRLFDLTLQLGLVSEAKSVAKVYLGGKNIPEIKQRLADLDFQEGKDQFDNRAFDEALNSFYAALENGEETARSWVVQTLLVIADSTPNNVQAIEHLEAALEIGGYNEELAEKIAEKYFAQDNYVKAIEYLRKIHEQSPMDSKIISRYATCLQKIGDYESAAQLLESLSQMGTIDVPTREQLFNYYRAQGRYEDAKRHFELLYTRGTEVFNHGLQALAWDQIRLMLEQGETAKAWQICSEELRNKPSSDMLGLAMKILSERVDCLVAENKVTEALQELEQGRALGLNLLDLGLREASLYETIGNDQAALKVYEEIARKAPEVWEKIKELYLKAATREYLAGNLAESRRLLEDAHAKLPKNQEIKRALGVLYQETGQYALAAALAQNSIEETDIQVPTDHLNVLRPHGYRRIRLG